MAWIWPQRFRHAKHITLCFMNFRSSIALAPGGQTGQSGNSAPTRVPFSWRVSGVYWERGFIGWTLPGWGPSVPGPRGLLAWGSVFGEPPGLGLQVSPTLHLPPILSLLSLLSTSAFSLATLSLLKYTEFFIPCASIYLFFNLNIVLGHVFIFEEKKEALVQLGGFYGGIKPQQRELTRCQGLAKQECHFLILIHYGTMPLHHSY